MMEFIIIMEIWTNAKLMYLAIEFVGNTLPSQYDMKDRDSIVEICQLDKPEYTFLDLVGVVQGDKIVWNDNMRSII